MSTSLAVTALLMGLAGGPHCAAMCGAACAGIARLGAPPGAQARWRSMGAFQAGRLTGYAVAGATAAFAVANLAALSSHMVALRPLWTLFHLAVLAWGLMMLAQAHQPQWVSAAGRAAWTRIRPLAGARGGVFMTGALWAFMPCGLLYSALLVASLSAGPLEGAMTMALFALGGSAALTLAPWLFKRLREGWGTRAAGALLVLVAAGSLWVDTAHQIAQWCQSL